MKESADVRGSEEVQGTADVREWVEHAVDRGARTVEEIHREIAGLPITLLETLGAPEDATQEIRRIQDRSIGAVYDVIRNVQHRVAELANELLEAEPRADA